MALISTVNQFIGIDNGDIKECARLAVTGLDINRFKDKSVTDEILLDKTAGIFYYRLKNGNIISIDQANRINICSSQIENWLKDSLFTKYDIYYYDITPFVNQVDVDEEGNIISDVSELKIDNFNVILPSDFKYMKVFVDLINPEYFSERKQIASVLNNTDYIDYNMSTSTDEISGNNLNTLISRDVFKQILNNEVTALTPLSITKISGNVINQFTVCLGIYIAFIK